LTIIGGPVAKSQAVIEARLKGTNHVCAKLNVMVLRLRTVSIAFHRIEDPNSESTAPVSTPNNDAIISTLNDIFRQCCIAVTLASGSSATHYITYDTNKDGRAQQSELESAFDFGDPAWGFGNVDIWLLKRSGIPYAPPNEAYYIRGILVVSGGVVFLENASGYADVAVAHEVGHFLDLSADGAYSSDGHDNGPWPSGTTALMRSGTPQNGTLPVPGKWIRHTDWRAANNAVGDLGP